MPRIDGCFERSRKLLATYERGVSTQSETPPFNGPFESPEFKEPPQKISGNADRYHHREGNDDYSQARALFNLFDVGQKSWLFSNIAESMQGAPDTIFECQLGYFEKVHPD